MTFGDPKTLRTQRCPHCGRVESAGSYCTRCLRRTEPDWLDTEPRRTVPAPNTGTLRPDNEDAGSLWG